MTVMNSHLALFDFDGTITNQDSFFYFIQYYKGRLSFIFGLIILLPLLFLYKLGLIKNSKAKEFVLTYFFKNDPLNKFQEKCDAFGATVIPEIIKPKALETIETHLKNGHRVIIITASAENWLSYWCRNTHIELIATRLEVKNGILTGKIAGNNCYGDEKVKRLKEYLNLSSYPNIYAYGDSKGDLPMLELANHKFYKTF
jgi:phosphatidylglycerophosphatase C